MSAAEKAAQEARAAEQALAQCVANEQQTAATLSRLEADACSHHGPVYNTGYSGAYNTAGSYSRYLK